MLRRLLLIVAVLCLATSWPSTVRGQTLSDLIPDLVGSNIVDNFRGPTGGPDHTRHFVPDFVLRALGSLQQINSAIVSQLPTFPVGSSSGGFTYMFDTAAGTFSRRSESFGPAFAERALTIGRQRFSFGMNYQRGTYDRLAGRDLDDGDLKFYIRHNDCCPPAAAGTSPLEPPFEGDVVSAALSIDLTTNIVAFFGDFGVTDNLDVGVAVPIVSVDLGASVTTTILRLATEGITPPFHSWTESGSAERAPISRRDSATGLGDILVRAKYNFLRRGPGGLAAAVDLRLPTGEVEELLGAGATQAKFFLIGSTAVGAVNPHFNFGYTVSGEGPKNQTDEVNFATGLDFSATDRLTLSADVIGRTLRDARRFVDTDSTFQFRTMAGVPLQSRTFTELGLEDGNLNLMLGAAGFKYNPTGNLLVSVNVLFPLSKAGLHDRITPVIGFDYAF